MKTIKKTLLGMLFFIILSCTDGMQVGQKVNVLIEEKKIEHIILKDENKFVGEFTVKEVVVDNQFLQVDTTFFNMERVKKMKVIGKKLELEM